MQPLLEQIRRLRREGKDVSTLVWALGSLDARAGIEELADILCRGSYVDAVMVPGVVGGFKGPLPPEGARRAITALRQCLPEGKLDEDRDVMIEYVIELLEGRVSANG